MIADLEPDSITFRLSVPVAVVLEKRIVTGAFWSQPAWSLQGVLTGEHLGAGTQASAEPTGRTDRGELYLWSGFRITLYRDACERYWHALIGEKPQVYVLACEDAADGTLEPQLVTLDYDEAVAHSESDGVVLSAPISGELYRLMEAFVVKHYKPNTKKARKRKNWSESTDTSPGRKDSVRRH